MFSGIIQHLGSITTFELLESGARIRLPRPESMQGLKAGASVAVDGACLTVENEGGDELQFFVGAETFHLLSWGDRYCEGSLVNLEASLHLGDPVDGHFVTGHVDSLARVVRRQQEGESLHLDIEVAVTLLGLIWHKGSLAINGVSLTINRIDGQRVSVCLIPETQARTNLGHLKEGDLVNIEPDVLARMVERQLGSYLSHRENKVNNNDI